ncbi:hypothetical protein [Candidatus Amarolinea dominans]|uniref:hypothetical protein n=1 Tax=Candidatus Amarolinea dominans TaxID=3140696 RepID=UPI001D9499A0|nr:hypothetical protein [Anaerolineae bacterium]
MALPRRQGLSAYVIAHGTVVVPDATNDLPPDLVQTAHFRASGTQAFVGMRLQQGETPVGVLFLNFAARVPSGRTMSPLPASWQPMPRPPLRAAVSPRQAADEQPVNPNGPGIEASAGLPQPAKASIPDVFSDHIWNF